MEAQIVSTTTKQTTVALWHYTCPECGIGNAESGYHAQTHAIYCEICLEDGWHVRLRRWPVDERSGTLAGGGSGRG